MLNALAAFTTLAAITTLTVAAVLAALTALCALATLHAIKAIPLQALTVSTVPLGTLLQELLAQTYQRSKLLMQTFLVREFGALSFQGQWRRTIGVHPLIQLWMATTALPTTPATYITRFAWLFLLPRGRAFTWRSSGCS